MSEPEAWMRGPLEGVSPFVAPLLFSFQQAREDLRSFTSGLNSEQIWHRTGNINPVGREIRHIGGSIDRLMTYLEGRQLDEQQLAALKSESTPGAGLEELLSEVETAFRLAEEKLRRLPPAALTEPREVGRKRLPTTVIGLIVHMAEHTQRHVGQAIAAAKLARH